MSEEWGREAPQLKTCKWEEFAKENDLDLKGAVSDSRVAAVATHHIGRSFLRGMTKGHARHDRDLKQENL